MQKLTLGIFCALIAAFLIGCGGDISVDYTPKSPLTKADWAEKIDSQKAAEKYPTKEAFSKDLNEIIAKCAYSKFWLESYRHQLRLDIKKIFQEKYKNDMDKGEEKYKKVMSPWYEIKDNYRIVFDNCVVLQKMSLEKEYLKNAAYEEVKLFGGGTWKKPVGDDEFTILIKDKVKEYQETIIKEK